MSASRIQIRQSPDAPSPSIPAHPANHFPESYRPQSITKTPHGEIFFFFEQKRLTPVDRQVRYETDYVLVVLHISEKHSYSSDWA